MAESPQISALRLTVEDYARLCDEEGPFEILDGERIERIPPLAGRSDIANRLAFLLNVHATQAGIGRALAEAAFIIPDAYDSEWVSGARISDVLYFDGARLSAYKEKHPDWREKPYLLVPDLAVEVVSRHDSYSEIDRKVRAYLGDGVRLVWVIDPRQQSVTVYAPDGTFTHLGMDDALSGGEVVAEFEMRVAALFED